MLLNSLELTGTLKFDPADPLLPLAKYVFQRTAPGKGNIAGFGLFDRQMRRHIIPLDPMTPAQLARRALMAAAVARWHASTPQDKDTWKINAQNRSITVFNACISDILKNYHLENGVLVKN